MRQLDSQRQRLAGMALVVGGALTIAGYFITGALFGSSEDERFNHSLFTPLYSIALVGVVLSILGLPAVLAAHKEREARLTLVGYVGTLTALVMLNLGEGVIEAFIKPYLANHGGIPDAPNGLGIYFGIAFLFVIVGLPSLGIAVIRAGVLPRWVGALIVTAVPFSFIGQALPGPLVELADYLLFIGLIAIGWTVAKPARNSERLFANAEVTA
jgi:hypothetical protein